MVQVDTTIAAIQPGLAGPFVGRVEVSADLQSFLVDPEHTRTAVAFISGIPGAGKSTLARQALAHVIGKDDWLFSYKYDQFNPASPASFFVHALDDLARRMRDMAPGKREEIRRHLIDAVSPNAQLLISLCPRLGDVLGPQPELIPLAPQENQIRLSFVLRKAVAVVARHFKRVTLFIDDLQWADGASLTVLTDLIADGSVTNLAVLACFRSGEGDNAAPLQRSIRMVGNPVFENEVGAFDDDDITLLLQHRLNLPEDLARELSAEIRTATNGTPLAAVNMLDLLQSEQLRGGPDDIFDLAKVRKTMASVDTRPDGYELVHRRLARLDAQSQDLLTISAYIGERIDLPLLALLTGLAHADLRARLDDLTNQGILDVSGESYRFAHDTFQRAAYDRDTPLRQRRAALRKTAARTFEDRFQTSDDSTWLFRAVTLFNQELDSLTDPKERQSVADLNRRAVRAALDSGGSARALDFARAGLSVTPADAWASDYPGMRQAHLDAAEAAYLQNDIERFDDWIDTAAENATTTVDWADAYLLRLQQKVSTVQYEAALDIAIVMLDKLGAPLPRKAGKAQVGVNLVRTMMLLRGRSTDDLYDLPHMTDARSEKELETLMLAASAAYFAEPNLFPLIVFQMVRLSVEQGNSRLSAFGWVCYGLAQCAVVGNVRAGYEYGALALRLTQAFKADDLRARVHMLFNTFVRHWSESRAMVAEHLLEGEMAGLASGDLEFATYCGWHRCSDAFWSGAPLDEIEVMVSEVLALGREHNQYKVVFLLELTQDVLAWIKDPEGPVPDDAAHEAFCIRHKDYTSLCYVKLYQALRHLLSGDSAACGRAIAEIDTHFESLQGQFYVPYFILLRGLAAAMENADRPSPTLIRQAHASRRKLKKWSARGAADVAPLADLAAAAALWTSGQTQKAQAGFDGVIAAARNGHAPVWCGVLAANALARMCEIRGSKGQAGWAHGQAGELAALWGVPGGTADDVRGPAPSTIGWSSAFDDRESWLQDACLHLLTQGNARAMSIELAQDPDPVCLLRAELRDGAVDLDLAATGWTAPPNTLPVPLPQPDGVQVAAHFTPGDTGKPGHLDARGLEPMLMPIVSELRRDGMQRKLRQAEEQRVALQTAYGRFIPGYLLSELGRADFADIRVGDFASNQMTVMFCDMRGATGIMEKIGPKASLELFNELFIAIESEVLRAGGYIDNFLGDAVLALFSSAPEDSVQTAARVARALEHVQQDIISRGLPAPGFGLGLSTGEVVFGAVGGLNQIRVGAIGDTLNLASRVESLTKRYGCVAMISEATFDQIRAPGEMRLRQVDHVTVVGRKNAVRLYEILDALPEAHSDAVWTNVETYNAALAAYYAGTFDAARDGLDTFLNAVPGDGPATLLRDRAARFAENAPGPDWTGVHVLQEK